MQGSDSHGGVKEQVTHFIEDLEHELEHEFAPGHDVSQSDKFVQKHGMGLIITLYAFVAVLMTFAILSIALFYHPHGA
jgi:hypothetical protein